MLYYQNAGENERNLARGGQGGGRGEEVEDKAEEGEKEVEDKAKEGEKEVEEGEEEEIPTQKTAIVGCLLLNRVL